ncbi:CoA transferase [Microbacterium ulmi]|uniref:Carnitine dehydratase n=1 Tax=Microbacterium ulmi TaxID=179095 RepID=A0A7Y2M2W0_9MICO|nr:CoA transferase [Microbacterium ulmi]NII70661.1 crotonobetainyl-CoA:carnitine CoA-transferase CaiB-like acyl-CoA transferase [Microbacterium ulmi]NNH04098.1 carnitine dehydratase [Microbacterium ulmi]
MATDQPAVPLPARTSVGALAYAAVYAASDAAARVAGGGAVRLDPERIAVAYASERHLRIAGEAPPAWAALSGFFRTSDGWVRTHGNYPHHASALRRGLGLPPDADGEALAAALAGVPAGVAVQAVSRSGGLCVAVNHEKPDVDDELRTTRLVEDRRLGAAPLKPGPGGPADAPLRGIRVLDLTRVIAGPVGTRTLALLGADVLRIDPPGMPEIAWQHLDTGHGKRSAVLDLASSPGRARFEALLADADVVALGYRPAALARLGLSPAQLAQRRPGVVVVRHTAWGDPDRRGFDSLVQASSGISWIESADGTRPGALPAQALDHSAGYLLAAAAIDLLARRAQEGGSWLAETSLRRIAAELLGMPRTAEPETAASFDPAPHLQTFDVDGALVTTAAPAVSYDGGPVAFAPPRPWGQDEPSWLAR